MRHRRDRLFRSAPHDRCFSFDDRSQAVSFLRRLRKNRINVPRGRSKPGVCVNGPRQAAVFTDAPEVNGHEQHHSQRENHHVKKIEADERLFSDVFGTQENQFL